MDEPKDLHLHTELNEREVTRLEELLAALDDSDLPDGVAWKPKIEALRKALTNLSSGTNPVPDSTRRWSVVKFHHAAGVAARALLLVYEGIGVKVPDDLRGPLTTLTDLSLDELVVPGHEAALKEIDKLKERIEHLEGVIEGEAESHESSARSLWDELPKRPRR